MSAIDFKKAFDTISHNKLWQALSRQNVPPQYITLLQALYSDQVATVKTDKISKPFHIQRGVKQGDPLSSLLFNALLEDIFAQLKHRWASRKYGIRLGHTSITTLTNLRFADDVLLFATTLPQLTDMLNDLHNLAGKYGLELHPEKTVILCNLSQRRGRQAATTTQVGGRHVKVLNYNDSTKYLGKKLSFSDHHTTEIDNRVSTAWRKFNAMSNELTNKRYRLHSRIHLLNATITPTILYGCASWTTTKTTQTKLRTVQRRMLRLIVGTVRRRVTNHTTNDTGALEPWIDYLKRATTTAEGQLQKLQIEDWPTIYLRRKWRWAARVSTQQHDRWTFLAARWQPQLQLNPRAQRRQSRPHKRWSDDFTTYFTTIKPTTLQDTNWLSLAATPRWQELEEASLDYHNITRDVDTNALSL